MGNVAIHGPAALEAARDTVRLPAAQRVLVVGGDAATLDQLTKLLGSFPALVEPVGAASAEEALQVLRTKNGFECLLADATPPDGLQLLLAARALRPDLRIVAMAPSRSNGVYREALESGAARVLTKPFDFEDLLASLAPGRPGSVAYLEGALDLVDVCRISTACQADGGLRVRQGESEGVLAHYGSTLVHAAVDGLSGAPAFASLLGWASWHFESISPSATGLAVNCELELAGDGVQRREGGRAGGHLRGLTLRHLIEWAMRGRQTCTLTVTSHGRTGVLPFEAGRILSAETADRDGGRAAAEILSWQDVRVDVIRWAELPPVRRGRGQVKGQGLQTLIDRFREEVDGFIATSVVRRKDGSAVAGVSLDPRLDAAAAGRFAGVVDSHLAAVEQLGVGPAWGETEDILITTARAYLLIRLLGEGHYHWLAVSSEANLALCRLLMRSHEPFLLSGLVDLGEIPGA